jgi:Protein of unknown function (DUF2782)
MNDPRPRSRFAVAVALLAAAGLALAQSAPLPPPPPPPPPPKLEPLPEIPPPPGAGIAGDPELEPQVTITRKEGETVEEARVNGKIVWVKVTPRHGKPYFLVPDGSGNVYIRRDSLDTGLRVPLWLLLEF